MFVLVLVTMATNTVYPSEVAMVLDIWRPYVAAIRDWKAVVRGVEPKATGCGPVYELAGLSGRLNESLAIADMRGMAYAQPHYHANGEVEIYFVLQGQGCVVVGKDVTYVEKGSVTVVPSGVVHYTLPDKSDGLVLAVVNTPPFNPKNTIDVTASNQAVAYDHEQFKALTQGL
jgi:mannose-6-phosphate isomerase-like protein (cupin superfamily)